MGFGPENEDLSDHPEKLLSVWVWTGQPARPAERQQRIDAGTQIKGLEPTQPLGKTFYSEFCQPVKVLIQ